MYNGKMTDLQENISYSLTALSQHRPAESGNALWFLLLAIVLLSALTMAVTGTSDTTEQSGSVERDRIAASEIMRFSKGVEQAITNMRMRGISENRISFETPDMAVYANGRCSGDDSCLVFHPNGGNIGYVAPGGSINDGTDWIFTGHNNVEGVGTAAPDLVMILPNIHDGICSQLNRMLDVSPANTDGTIDFTLYTGNFSAAETIQHMSGARAGCQDNEGEDYDKIFYQVLIAR